MTSHQPLAGGVSDLPPSPAPPPAAPEPRQGVNASPDTEQGVAFGQRPRPISASDPQATALPKATTPSAKSPGRFLDPELAAAIKQAKLKTGASWRRVAKFTGLSHSFLVQLSNGQRVPSKQTVEVLAEWLPIEEWAVQRLREVAVEG